MEKYEVIIKEISKTTVEVEANSLEEARALVEKEYWKNPLEYTLEAYDTFFE